MPWIIPSSFHCIDQVWKCWKWLHFERYKNWPIDFCLRNRFSGKALFGSMHATLYISINQSYVNVEFFAWFTGFSQNCLFCTMSAPTASLNRAKFTAMETYACVYLQLLSNCD